MNKSIKYFTALLLVAGLSIGCENFLTPSVDQEKPVETAISSTQDFQNAVNAALGDYNSVAVYGRDFPVTLEVSSDNAFSNENSNRFGTQDQLDYTVSNGYASGLWEVLYETIADVNLALQNDLTSSPEVEDIRGQGLAIRALSHMNLLMSYGQQFIDGGDPAKGVPYITTFAGDDSYPPRDPVSEVWNMIGQDFSDGLSAMDQDSFDPVYMNYWGAKALQTRYFLYSGQYDQVITAAEEIINSGNFSITPASDYVAAWESGSGPQSLFEIAFTSTDRLAFDNISRIYRDTNYGDVEVSEDLYNEYDSGDVRLDLYSNNGGVYRMVSKYPDENGTDNVRVIRYAEVILNYAEALARTPGRQGDALIELTKITSNRNVAPYTAGTVENVLRERRLELAMEGHRLFDLARTNSAIPVSDNAELRQEEIPAGDFRFALPIPDDEIQANSNMTQNEGYN